MGEALKKWLKKPLYVYMLGVFFLVYRTMQFPQDFQLFLFIVLLSAHCLLVFFLQYILIIKFKFKNANYWLFIFFLFILFYQEIGEVIAIISNNTHFRIRYLALIYFAISYIGFYVYKIIVSRHKNLFNSINLFFLLLLLINIISGFYISTKAEAAFKKSMYKDVYLKKSVKPNDIIWILLDEYASTSYLQKECNYTNAFGNSLRKKGFYVDDSIPSRNDTTLYSITSLFQLDDSSNYSNYSYAQHTLKSNLFVKKLVANGYKFIAYDFLGFPVISQLKAKVLTIFPDNYLDQLFYNTVISVYFSIITKNEEKIDLYNTEVFNKSIQSIQTHENRLRFFWIHLLSPHSPFCRDSLGNKLQNIATNINSLGNAEIKKQYCSYLALCNKKVLTMLTQIPDWKEKTIVISGDHGFRQLVKPGNPYRKATFAAIYYPDMDTTELKQIHYLQQIALHLRY